MGLPLFTRVLDPALSVDLTTAEMSVAFHPVASRVLVAIFAPAASMVGVDFTAAAGIVDARARVARTYR